MWRKALQKIIWRNSSHLSDCQGSTTNNWRGSWVKLWATYERTHAITKNNEAMLVLDYYGCRMRSLCSKVPLMPSPWRSEAHATYDFTLAILYMRNRYYWEDLPNNIQCPWIHTCCYWLFHKMGRSCLLRGFELKESCSIYLD